MAGDSSGLHVLPYPSDPNSLKNQHPVFVEELLVRASALIARIRPIKLSNERRKLIVDHVTRIIKRCFEPYEVTAVAFGSVPLGTYLPDGDIDLSIYSFAPNSHEIKEALKETWATQLQLTLEDECGNTRTNFKVADVQVIHAEVKLLKCLVDNIVVDISFFQVGGLNTYSFLEDVDKFVGRNLFKESIILVKGWCYYESRTLGAHHGLISTYALETLVLYVINLYHRELTHPLQVLYKFLVEFSAFDWEHYCVSLQGPIPLASFPHPKPEPPEALLRNPLLTEAFMAEAHAKYTAPYLAQLQAATQAAAQAHAAAQAGGAQGGPGMGMPPPPTNYLEAKPFAIRQLNVVDPLLPNNNLGRSVSKASYLRIKRAFEHGGRMLAHIAEQAKVMGALEAVQAFDSFFGKVWNAQRQRTRTHHHMALPAEAANGVGPGMLHHPVAQRPAAPLHQPHLVPPGPSTSAPPIPTAGNGMGAPGAGVVGPTGHMVPQAALTAAAAAAGVPAAMVGGRMAASASQIMYGQLAGDLHTSSSASPRPAAQPGTAVAQGRVLAGAGPSTAAAGPGQRPLPDAALAAYLAAAGRRWLYGDPHAGSHGDGDAQQHPRPQSTPGNGMPMVPPGFGVPSLEGLALADMQARQHHQSLLVMLAAQMIQAGAQMQQQQQNAAAVGGTSSPRAAPGIMPSSTSGGVPVSGAAAAAAMVPAALLPQVLGWGPQAVMPGAMPAAGPAAGLNGPLGSPMAAVAAAAAAAGPVAGIGRTSSGGRGLTRVMSAPDAAAAPHQAAEQQQHAAESALTGAALPAVEPLGQAGEQQVLQASHEVVGVIESAPAAVEQAAEPLAEAEPFASPRQGRPAPPPAQASPAQAQEPATISAAEPGSLAVAASPGPAYVPTARGVATAPSAAGLLTAPESLALPQATAAIVLIPAAAASPRGQHAVDAQADVPAAAVLTAAWDINMQPPGGAGFDAANLALAEDAAPDVTALTPVSVPSYAEPVEASPVRDLPSAFPAMVTMPGSPSLQVPTSSPTAVAAAAPLPSIGDDDDAQSSGSGDVGRGHAHDGMLLMHQLPPEQRQLPYAVPLELPEEVEKQLLHPPSRPPPPPHPPPPPQQHMEPLLVQQPPPPPPQIPGRHGGTMAQPPGSQVAKQPGAFAMEASMQPRVPPNLAHHVMPAVQPPPPAPAMRGTAVDAFLQPPPPVLPYAPPLHLQPPKQVAPQHAHGQRHSTPTAGRGQPAVLPVPTAAPPAPLPGPPQRQHSIPDLDPSIKEHLNSVLKHMHATGRSSGMPPPVQPNPKPTQPPLQGLQPPPPYLMAQHAAGHQLVAPAGPPHYPQAYAAAMPYPDAARAALAQQQHYQMQMDALSRRHSQPEGAATAQQLQRSMQHAAAQQPRSSSGSSGLPVYNSLAGQAAAEAIAYASTVPPLRASAGGSASSSGAVAGRRTPSAVGTPSADAGAPLTGAAAQQHARLLADAAAVALSDLLQHTEHSAGDDAAPDQHPHAPGAAAGAPQQPRPTAVPAYESVAAAARAGVAASRRAHSQDGSAGHVMHHASPWATPVDAVGMSALGGPGGISVGAPVEEDEAAGPLHPDLASPVSALASLMSHMPPANAAQLLSQLASSGLASMAFLQQHQQGAAGQHGGFARASTGSVGAGSGFGAGVGGSQRGSSSSASGTGGGGSTGAFAGAGAPDAHPGSRGNRGAAQAQAQAQAGYGHPPGNNAPHMRHSGNAGMGMAGGHMPPTIAIPHPGMHPLAGLAMHLHPAAAIHYNRMAGLSPEAMLLAMSPGISPPTPHMPHLPPPPPPATAHNIQHSPPSWLYHQLAQRTGMGMPQPYMPYDMGQGQGHAPWLNQSPHSHGQSSGSHLPPNSAASSAGSQQHSKPQPYAPPLQPPQPPQGPGAAAGKGAAPGASSRSGGASVPAVPGVASSQPPLPFTPEADLEFTRAMVAAMSRGATAAEAIAQGHAASLAAAVQASSSGGGAQLLDDQLLFDVESLSSTPSGSLTASRTQSALPSAHPSSGGGVPAGVMEALQGLDVLSLVAGGPPPPPPPAASSAAASVHELRQQLLPDVQAAQVLAGDPATHALHGSLPEAAQLMAEDMPPPEGVGSVTMQTLQQPAVGGARSGHTMASYPASPELAAAGAGHDPPHPAMRPPAGPSAPVACPPMPPAPADPQSVAGSGSAGGPSALLQLTPPAVTPTSLSSTGSSPLSHSPVTGPIVPPPVLTAPLPPVATALPAAPSPAVVHAPAGQPSQIAPVATPPLASVSAATSAASGGTGQLAAPAAPAQAPAAVAVANEGLPTYAPGAVAAAPVENTSTAMVLPSGAVGRSTVSAPTPDAAEVVLDAPAAAAPPPNALPAQPRAPLMAPPNAGNSPALAGGAQQALLSAAMDATQREGAVLPGIIAAAARQAPKFLASLPSSPTSAGAARGSSNAAFVPALAADTRSRLGGGAGVAVARDSPVRAAAPGAAGSGGEPAAVVTQRCASFEDSEASYSSARSADSVAVLQQASSSEADAGGGAAHQQRQEAAAPAHAGAAARQGAGAADPATDAVAVGALPDLPGVAEAPDMAPAPGSPEHDTHEQQQAAASHHQQLTPSRAAPYRPPHHPQYLQGQLHTAVVARLQQSDAQTLGAAAAAPAPAAGGSVTPAPSPAKDDTGSAAGRAAPASPQVEALKAPASSGGGSPRRAAGSAEHHRRDGSHGHSHGHNDKHASQLASAASAASAAATVAAANLGLGTSPARRSQGQGHAGAPAPVSPGGTVSSYLAAATTPASASGRPGSGSSSHSKGQPSLDSVSTATTSGAQTASTAPSTAAHSGQAQDGRSRQHGGSHHHSHGHGQRQSHQQREAAAAAAGAAGQGAPGAQAVQQQRPRQPRDPQQWQQVPSSGRRSSSSAGIVAQVSGVPTEMGGRWQPRGTGPGGRAPHHVPNAGPSAGPRDDQGAAGAGAGPSAQRAPGQGQAGGTGQGAKHHHNGHYHHYHHHSHHGGRGGTPSSSSAGPSENSSQRSRDPSAPAHAPPQAAGPQGGGRGGGGSGAQRHSQPPASPPRPASAGGSSAGGGRGGRGQGEGGGQGRGGGGRSGRASLDVPAAAGQPGGRG